VDAEAEAAHHAVVTLNDRWALDGRDPCGHANVSWCFGLHDRPWPERSVFGNVRAMTSASARRKLDFEGYLERWTRDDGGASVGRLLGGHR
jgi:deoxyribodipyrimidine photo-lyase